MLTRSRAHFALKAIQELGLKQTIDFARYQIGLKSGYYKYVTERAIQKVSAHPLSLKLHNSFIKPNPESIAALLGSEGISHILTEADEISTGRVRLFGGPPIQLELNAAKPLNNWTEYESRKLKLWHEDIKWIWEPARFGWVFTLGRAYVLSREEKYPQMFWCYFESFQSENPPNLGPQWVSGQEVALRLMAFVFAVHVFAKSPSSTPKRITELARAIAIHAARIPPTMRYAQAQNNNHLLSEAAGLLTAGLTLPDHPQAGDWLKLGFHWFNYGIQTQISPDGTYVQHSTNYHRLMLQLALWVQNLTNSNTHSQTQTPGINNEYTLPRSSILRLADATRWILALLDPNTGHVPNLGPNDGAYIFPFSICPFKDYRPVVQAAFLAFHGEKILEPGPWDEMALWYGLKINIDEKHKTRLYAPIPVNTSSAIITSPHIIRKEDSWAYLRAAEFHSRPGHADQLHVDLWWRGINITQDAGTYLYNGSPPWANSLTRTAVHNTITIDGADQMTYAGRFLWLDWAQASVTDYDKSPQGSYDRLVAQHNGYHYLNLIHQRTIEYLDKEWIIKDDVLPLKLGNAGPSFQDKTSVHKVNLHWLVPDWPWELEDKMDKSQFSLRLLSPFGWIRLEISSPEQKTNTSELNDFTLQIHHKGKPIYGTDQARPILGWISQTYGYKHPALSIIANRLTQTPTTLVSKWIFPS